MGLIRNITKTATLFLFSLFLSLSILTFFIYNLTNYDNAKNLFTILFKEAVKNRTLEIEEIYNATATYCNLKPDESIQLPNNISLKCSEIINTNPNYMLNLIAEKSFNQTYYKNYECEITECLKEIKTGEDIFVFFSFKGHNFFSSIIKPLYILTIIFGILLFVSIETWTGRLKIFGFEFLFIGIFYFLLPYFKKLMSEKILKGMPISENILDLIFNQLNQIFMIFLISGIILIIIWGFTKLFVKFKKPKHKSK